MIEQKCVGTVVDGRYRILSILGQGGMGAVYRATEDELGREVALKVLHFAQVSDGDSRARFEREGRILSCLSHRNIVLVYRFGFWNEQVPYLSMEYLEGKSLRQVLDEGGAMAAKRCLPIALETCDALEAAHALSIVHRDIKPSNIILLAKPEPDFVKVVDFGLAKLASEAGTQDQRLTQTGVLLGTPQYLSPEQCLGREADNRSDIYALACVIYEAIAGRPVFEAENPIGLLHKHATEEPVPLSVVLGEKLVPEGLDAVLLKALAKKPEERYQSMTELKEALNLVNSGRGSEIEAAVPGVVSSRRAGRQKRMAVLAGVLLLVFMIMAGTFYWWKYRFERQIAKEIPDAAKEFSYPKDLLRANELSKQAHLLLERKQETQAKALYYRALLTLAAEGERKGKWNAQEQTFELEILRRIVNDVSNSKLGLLSLTNTSDRLRQRYEKMENGLLAIEFNKFYLYQDEYAFKAQAVAHRCCDLASQCFSNGLSAESMFYLGKAKNFADYLGEQGHLEQADYYTTKASLLIAQGKQAEAAAFIRSVIPSVVSWTKQDPKVYIFLFKLGQLLIVAGDDKSADSVFVELEKLSVSGLQKNFLEPGDFYAERARFFARRGEYKRAEKMLRDKIDQVNKLNATYKWTRTFFAVPKQELANILRDQGEFAEAIEYYHNALASIDPVVAVETRTWPQSYEGLALCYQKQNRCALAETTLKTGLEKSYQIIPKTPLWSIGLLDQLVCLSLAQGKLMQADEYIKQIDALLKQVEASPCGQLVQVKNMRKRLIGRQAHLLACQKSYAQSEKLYRQAIDNFVTWSVEDFQTKAQLLAGLSEVLLEEKKVLEAKHISEEALKLAVVYCGVDDELTKSIRSRLAGIGGQSRSALREEFF